MDALIQTLGGVGLFLLGMALMTSGLRKLAGAKLRTWLARSTQNPARGVLTGAALTALVQSSTATTVATIGFVSAGLMSFTQALSIVLGANIGTTFTGWMVALIGFKLKLTTVALPVLFVASLLYLFKPAKHLHGLGKALSGFCLIFIGISFLQTGLAAHQEAFSLVQWSANSLSGRLVLVMIGIGLTLIMQSSSATIAIAITALDASLIDLPQTIAMMIGADIGTTSTAALATIGGTTASRRTGIAHVMYNLMIGTIGFFIIQLYLWGFSKFSPAMLLDSPEVVAVSFHTSLNFLGVLLVLPFMSSFARLIERMIPDRTDSLLASFDRNLLEDPYAAMAGLEAGTRKLSLTMLDLTSSHLTLRETAVDSTKLDRVLFAVATGRAFAVEIGEDEITAAGHNPAKVFGYLHQLDHVERLCERIQVLINGKVVLDAPDLVKPMYHASQLIGGLTNAIRAGNQTDVTDRLRELSQQLEQDKSGYRENAIRRAVRREISGEQLNQMLDAQRWLRRVVYHTSRIADYWQQSEHPDLDQQGQE